MKRDDHGVRRRRLLAMGVLLPGKAGDDTDHGWGDDATPRAGDQEADEGLRREVPPHHDS